MPDFILLSILYIFAFYGLITLIINISGLIYFKTHCKGARIILAVKNREKNIEGTLRAFFSFEVARKVMAENRLTVVDMNSSDQTRDIVEKMSSNHGNIEILSSSEKNRAFDGL